MPTKRKKVIAKKQKEEELEDEQVVEETAAEPEEANNEEADTEAEATDESDDEVSEDTETSEDEVSEDSVDESSEDTDEETPAESDDTSSDDSSDDVATDDAPTPTEEHHKPLRIHGVMVSLLFALILLTLVTVGIMVSTRSSAPRAEDFSLACRAEVEGALLGAARQITKACASAPVDDAANTLSVPATGGGVGFSYPTGWSVMTTINRATPATWSANLVPGHFTFCQACDGPLIDISMQAGNKAESPVVDHTTFTDYLNFVFSATNGYSEVATTTTAEKTGTRYVLTGKIDGLYTGRFEAIYFEGSTQWAGVTFIDADPNSSTTNAAWAVVKDSLDFTEIK